MAGESDKNLRASRSLRVVRSMPVRAAHGHETLLVVEDEPMILRVARLALEKLGYRVLCANDGQAALQIARDNAAPIDLVITDVIMPRLGGRELARRLQELRPGTKVLFTSGDAETRDGLELLQKPYAPAALTRSVRELLDRRS